MCNRRILKIHDVISKDLVGGKIQRVNIEKVQVNEGLEGVVTFNYLGAITSVGMI